MRAGYRATKYTERLLQVRPPYRSRHRPPSHSKIQVSPLRQITSIVSLRTIRLAIHPRSLRPHRPQRRRVQELRGERARLERGALGGRGQPAQGARVLGARVLGARVLGARAAQERGAERPPPVLTFSDKEFSIVIKTGHTQ